ncbi:hypothetical protein [Pseudomonas phage vB_PaeM_PAO1_Ab03]|uniref:Uncharacterized protein n=1 Tax=Pseudomonas phage vB_PaeM_PAO1_Ab03 TaxID=1548901 RepID=A0A0A1IU66_9CAUD|nr:hypothetical protein VC54_gp048 [Pseudomonas phage vB_PaeM_PAO1_Ab03]CEF89153.1 hypothetical protein [Pseudomonas phage vB_PaeM_PAO1_Ab03]
MKTMIVVEELNNGLTVYRPKVKMYQPLLDRLFSWHPNKWRDCHLVWPTTVKRAARYVSDPANPYIDIPEAHLEKVFMAEQEINERTVKLKDRCPNIKDLSGEDLSKSFAELVLDMCIDSYNAINGCRVEKTGMCWNTQRKRGGIPCETEA